MFVLTQPIIFSSVSSVFVLEPNQTLTRVLLHHKLRFIFQQWFVAVLEDTNKCCPIDRGVRSDDASMFSSVVINDVLSFTLDDLLADLSQGSNSKQAVVETQQNVIILNVFQCEQKSIMFNNLVILCPILLLGTFQALQSFWHIHHYWKLSILQSSFVQKSLTWTCSETNEMYLNWCLKYPESPVWCESYLWIFESLWCTSTEGCITVQ